MKQQCAVFQAVDLIKKLYELFIKHDSTMIEINPMAEDSTGKGNEPDVLCIVAGLVRIR